MAMADETTSVDEQAAGEAAAQEPESQAPVAEESAPAGEADEPAAAAEAAGADGSQTQEAPADEESAAAPETADAGADGDADAGGGGTAAAADPAAESPDSPEEAAGPERIPLPEVTEETRRILRVRVPVIVKLAEKQLSLGDIADLSLGSIVEFSKNADLPLDLLVNNKVIAHGIAVKVGEKFGLRIDEILPVAETIRSLGA